MAEEVDKRPVGRPYKFTDPMDLKVKINAYFANCDPHIAERIVLKQKQTGDYYEDKEKYITEQQPYIISGLALHLETSRKLLLDYQNPAHYNETIAPEVRDELINTIHEAKDRCEAYMERYMFSGRPTRGAELVARNGYGWVDKKEVDTKASPQDDLDALDHVDEGKQEIANAAQAVLDREKTEVENGQSGTEASGNPGEGSAPSE